MLRKGLMSLVAVTALFGGEASGKIVTKNGYTKCDQTFPGDYIKYSCTFFDSADKCFIAEWYEKGDQSNINYTIYKCKATKAAGDDVKSSDTFESSADMDKKFEDIKAKEKINLDAFAKKIKDPTDEKIKAMTSAIEVELKKMESAAA